MQTMGIPRRLEGDEGRTDGNIFLQSHLVKDGKNELRGGDSRVFIQFPQR